MSSKEEVNENQNRMIDVDDEVFTTFGLKSKPTEEELKKTSKLLQELGVIEKEED